MTTPQQHAWNPASNRSSPAPGASQSHRQFTWSAGDEDDPSSSDTPNRAKRAQVKNACVNCQRACKKCDSGRPCLRCVKYNLQESCVDSKRKPRKKGIKRGPYKKRKKNVDDDAAAAAAASGVVLRPTATAAAAASSMMASQYQSAPETAAVPSEYRQSEYGPISGPSTLRQILGASDNSNRRSIFSTRPRPPQILGPGAIPILLSDPIQDDNGSGDLSSGSDTPLVQNQQQQSYFYQYHNQHRTSLRSPLTMPSAAARLSSADIMPETPTMGLTSAFDSLATTQQPYRMSNTRYQQHQAHQAHQAHQVQQPPQPSMMRPYSHNSGGTFRLPPIASFDRAHPVRSPPSSNSLAILTDVALGRSTMRPPPPSNIATQLSHLSTTSPPPHHRHHSSMPSHSHSHPHLRPQQPPLPRPHSDNPVYYHTPHPRHPPIPMPMPMPMPMPPRQHQDQQMQHPDDLEQQSQISQPKNTHSRHTTKHGESDFSTSYASSLDGGRVSPQNMQDSVMESNIQRLSRQMNDTHLDQESLSEH
ncbi:hypothetical protein LPJ66_001245 [Kickxella alabastrina]|uniref:Uncharacterized protein n=1 Tax=Kickxella alabastrina TaxID=61397 RepID=A0ACC1ITZ3_9FUNG|nr:hypothetical protein LPJ66_001245 [Kickxella alabastrina]